MHSQDFLRAVAHDLLQNLLFIPQKLDLAKEYASKLLLFIRRCLKSKYRILALFGAKPDLFEVNLTLRELVKLKAFLLADKVLNYLYLSALLMIDIIVAHLDCELKRTFLA